MLKKTPGNLDQADNYRGVSLSHVISRCYTSIRNRRIYTWLEETCSIVENQAGFRKNYSTTYQIFNVYAVVQTCLSENGQKLYAAFVDFKKAFDSVHHDTLLEVVYNEGVKGNIFRALKSMYNSFVSCARINNECCGFFFNSRLESTKGL